MKLQFSIRDLLFLTALSATLTAWFLDRDRLQQRFEAFELDQPRLPESSVVFEVYHPANAEHAE
jgi:hypothetical protein